MTAPGSRPRWRSPRAAAAAALCLWLVATSVSTVSQDEQGVVLRFGRVARVVPAGIHFTLPWPAERLVAVSTTEVRSVAVGFLPGERARGLVPEPREVQWLTGDTNIVELQVTVNYTVADPVAWLFGASGDGGDRGELLKSVAEQALTAALARMPIDEVLVGAKAELVRAVGRAAQGQVDALGLGVRIGAVNLVEASPPQAVISSFNDVSSAKSDRDRRVTEADGYASSLLPKARATAARAVGEAEIYRAGLLGRARGDSSRFLELEAEVRKDPGLAMRRLWLEAVERILGQAAVRVVQPATDGARRRVWVR